MNWLIICGLLIIIVLQILFRPKEDKSDTQNELKRLLDEMQRSFERIEKNFREDFRLNREEGMTVVLITHHMDEATHAGRVVAMNDGKIVADGTPAEVFSQVELLRSVGLSVPETTELLYALRADGFDLPLDALSIDQCAQALYDRIKA